MQLGDGHAIADRVQQLGDAEVRQLDGAVTRHHQVRGLNVSVDDVPGVGGAETQQQGPEHGACERGPHQRIAVLLAKMPDKIFLKPLEGEVVLSAVSVVPGGEQSHDVRVREGSQRCALAQEALLAQRVIDCGAVVELDRDQRSGAGVIARAIDVCGASNPWWLGL